MTDVPDRVARAFRDHGSFAPSDDGYEFTTTAFDAHVTAAGEGATLTFEVTVRVPTLDAVTVDEVAPVVEEGWYETFERRVVDVGGVTAGEYDLSPAVRRAGRDVVVELSFETVNERRGVDDAGALVNFVEGTYVQGVIPGYEYTGPVTDLLSRAEEAAGF